MVLLMSVVSVFWERGYPDLPACGLRRGSRSGPVRSIFINTKLKTLAGRAAGSFLRHGLVRLAHDEAERPRWGTSRGARDASHDDQGQAGVGLRRVLVSPLVQRGKRRQGYQAKATISVQQDQDQ